jgi:hypothetical protein
MMVGVRILAHNAVGQEFRSRSRPAVTEGTGESGQEGSGTVFNLKTVPDPLWKTA